MFRGKWLGNPIKFYNQHQGQYATLHLCEGDLYVMIGNESHRLFYKIFIVVTELRS